MVGFVPKEMFFTKGAGKHREKLTSFELCAPIRRHRRLQSRPRLEHFSAQVPHSVPGARQ